MYVTRTASICVYIYIHTCIARLQTKLSSASWPASPARSRKERAPELRLRICGACVEPAASQHPPLFGLHPSSSSATGAWADRCCGCFCSTLPHDFHLLKSKLQQLLLLGQARLLLACLGLLLQGLLLHLLCLLGMDGLHQHSLVLVAVTLGVAVEVVVDSLVDLLLLSVLAEETAKDTLSAHPQDLRGHSCLTGTLALSDAGVSPLALRLQILSHSGARMHLHCLADDQAILDHLPRIGHKNPSAHDPR